MADPIPAEGDLAASTATATEEISALLALFEQMDEADPLMRLGIAAGIVAASIFMVLLTRFLIGRRVKRLEALDPKHFKPMRWQAQDLMSSEDMKMIWCRAWRVVAWALTFVFTTFAVIGLLMAFTWTTELAARLIILVLSAINYVWTGFVDYLPNLFTIIVILLVARFVIRTISLIFDGIKSRRIYLKNFYPEWADTSLGLIKLLVYALTAVIIFPYMPGSSSPAFQGISIFVGVLVSLGSTTAVANVVAGVVLTYTRAFKVGDQVELADVRGRIVERSTFVTRIQTLKNVIVSIPNSMVLTNNVINYSQNMGQTGLLVHTKITIGYDVPWQQVQKLLIAAAEQTENIVAQPAPFVLQTSLDDYYVSYEINGWTRKPEELPKIYSNLHANILDQFHGHKVEITSPRYSAVRDGNPLTVPEVILEGTVEETVEEETEGVGEGPDKTPDKDN